MQNGILVQSVQAGLPSRKYSKGCFLPTVQNFDCIYNWVYDNHYQTGTKEEKCNADILVDSDALQPCT